MKISPVNIFCIQNQQNIRSRKTTASSFRSNDRTSFGTILDRQIAELKETFDSEINPFFEEIKPKYIQIGKIGYDSQEKLKIVNNYTQKLFQKRFTYEENPVLQKVKKYVEPYEQYRQNIKTFERTSNFIQNSEIYSTPEIKKFIEKNKAKIYQDAEEFEKLKPLHDKYEQTKDLISTELEAKVIQNRPEFAKKIEELNYQNKEAVMLMLVSGYPEVLKLTTDAGNLFKDYNEKKEPLYKLMERAEKLSYDAQDFQMNTMENRAHIDDEIDSFLKRNKNYLSENLSEDEIKTVYSELLEKADSIIEKNTQSLDKYYTSHQIKISPRVIDRTLNAQNRVNKKLNALLLQEKQKIYNA